MSSNCIGSSDIFAVVSTVFSEDNAGTSCSRIAAESFSSLRTSHIRDCVGSLSASTERRKNESDRYICKYGLTERTILTKN